MSGKPAGPRTRGAVRHTWGPVISYMTGPHTYVLPILPGRRPHAGSDTGRRLPRHTTSPPGPTPLALSGHLGTEWPPTVSHSVRNWPLTARSDGSGAGVQCASDHSV